MENDAHIRLIFGKANKAIEEVDRTSISHTGLTLTDFMILEALLHKGPLPINDIGKKILLTSGSMTAAVDRLSKRGLIDRVQDPLDRRRSPGDPGSLPHDRLAAPRGVSHPLSGRQGAIAPGGVP